MAVFMINQSGSSFFDSNYLKATTDIIFSYAYEAVSKYPEPNREDYESEAEYKKAFNDYLMKLVEYVSKIKHDVFCDVLDSYNNSITVEGNLENDTKELFEMIKRNINYFNGNIRRGIISTVICSLLFPINMMPIFIGLGLGRYVVNKSKIKRSMMVTTAQKEMLKQFSDDKNNMYLLQDTLRTDFHKRKEELDELKRLILSGKVNEENKDIFIERLKELINPEGYEIGNYDKEFYEGRLLLLRLLGMDLTLDAQVSQLVKK